MWPFLAYRGTCLYADCEQRPFHTKWRLRFLLHDLTKHKETR